MTTRIIRFKTCPICKQEFQCPVKIGLKNWTKRKYCSRICLAKALPTGENAYAWKDDNLSYSGIHRWVERMSGKPRECSFCKTTTAKKFEWANISKDYKRDLLDWVRLCASCHRNYDKNWLKRYRDKLGRFTGV